MKPNPTMGESGSYKALGVIRMAKAVKGSLVNVPSTKWGPCGWLSQSRTLAKEAVFRVSSSTGTVKPKAPKKEHESLVWLLS